VLSRSAELGRAAPHDTRPIPAGAREAQAVSIATTPTKEPEMLTTATPPLEPRDRAEHLDAARPVTATTVCRVVVADDHPLYREGIVRALRAHGGFEVVAEAADGAEALRLIREHKPDLALLDVRMPGLDGVDVVHALAIHGPDVPVVMLSAFTDVPLVESALAAGAAGYLDKREDRRVLCERLVEISAGLEGLAPATLRPHDSIQRSGQWLPRLTSGEHEVLQLAGAGLDKLEIAESLRLTESTVRARATSITCKLECDSLADAVREARALQLIR
jgi:two-component system nitrate/nitrite response regulator NarL